MLRLLNTLYHFILKGSPGALSGQQTSLECFYSPRFSCHGDQTRGAWWYYLTLKIAQFILFIALVYIWFRITFASNNWFSSNVTEFVLDDSSSVPKLMLKEDIDAAPWYVTFSIGKNSCSSYYFVKNRERLTMLLCSGENFLTSSTVIWWWTYYGGGSSTTVTWNVLVV